MMHQVCIEPDAWIRVRRALASDIETADVGASEGVMTRWRPDIA